MSPYAYTVGDHVAGADAEGKAFAGRVTRIVGPWTIAVDGVITPASLITGWPPDNDGDPNDVGFDYDPDE